MLYRGNGGQYSRALLGHCWVGARVIFTANVEHLPYSYGSCYRAPRGIDTGFDTAHFHHVYSSTTEAVTAVDRCYGSRG